MQRLSDRELARQSQVIEKDVDIGLGKCVLGTCKNFGVFPLQTVVPQENDRSAQDEVKHPPRRAAGGDEGGGSDAPAVRSCAQRLKPIGEGGNYLGRQRLGIGPQRWCAVDI